MSEYEIIAKSHEEIASYDKIKAESIIALQKKANKKKFLDTDPQDISPGIVSIFNLPFEPVWYVPLMFLGAITSISILYQSGPQYKTKEAELRGRLEKVKILNL